MLMYYLLFLALSFYDIPQKNQALYQKTAGLGS